MLTLRKHHKPVTQLAQDLVTLRRWATLVAQGVSAAEMFNALTDGLGGLLPGDRVLMGRLDANGRVIPVATWDRAPGPRRLQPDLTLEAAEVVQVVARTGTPARVNSDGPGSRVAVPIRVEGALWGVMVAASTGATHMPPDAETRLSEFTDLLAIVIANAESRAALGTSRARLVAASDETRRRIERDLHDGAQQQLVSLALEVRKVEASVPQELGTVRAELSHVADGITDLLEDLRTISRGIHPAILDSGGLGPAVKMLARRSGVPATVSVETSGRFAECIEVAAYYVVSETLANVAKHARASQAEVRVETWEGRLRVVVRDDGIGGADPHGPGLVGLADRVEALAGSFTVNSPEGGGTSVEVELPLPGTRAEANLRTEAVLDERPAHARHAGPADSACHATH